MPLTLEGLANFLERSSSSAKLKLEADVLKIGEIVQKSAKEMIGNENPLWPPLSPVTLEDKERRGFEIPKPLLRTGELRDSIHMEALGLEMAVGSNDKNAVFHEFGTSKMPPRPFLGTAMLSNLETAQKKLLETAEILLNPFK